MTTPKTSIADPGKFFVDQEVARTAEMEAQTSVADNWDRVIREEPRQVLTPPQAAAILKGKASENISEEESEGARVLALWKQKGVLSCQ